MRGCLIVYIQMYSLKDATDWKGLCGLFSGPNQQLHFGLVTNGRLKSKAVSGHV